MQPVRHVVLSRYGFAGLLVLANTVFWLIFAVSFVSESYHFEPHTKLFEEPSSPYIFWSRAFPVERYMSPFMRTTRLLQWPSFYAAAPFNFYVNRRGFVVDDLFWGISVGGYYIIFVCLLSFFQWCLIGSLADYIKRRARNGSRQPEVPTV
jgi:hypothetical protein